MGMDVMGFRETIRECLEAGAATGHEGANLVESIEPLCRNALTVRLAGGSKFLVLIHGANDFARPQGDGGRDA